ncbi:MAG: hypothetical protein M3250_07015 [Thermoproteota archaeon]|jgi:hypothetical protein|nr:hypothetical protein [Thermoproteota archaeon]
MLVKVNEVSNNKVRVTKLDIDDYGSIIPLKELEFNLPTDDDLIIQILKHSPYAAIFTEGNNDDNNDTIILASGMTIDDLNEEKNKIINALNKGI